MKNIFQKLPLIFSCLFISYNFSYSQVAIAIKSGINIATVKDLVAFPKNRVGWYAGVEAKFKVSSNILFQPEMLYSTKGYRYIGNLNETAKSSIRLNYVNIPLLAGYQIDRKTTLLFGPEFGYLMSSRQTLSNGEHFNVSRNYPVKFDLSLDVGIDYSVTNCIGAEARYNYGFHSIYRVDEVGTRFGEILAGNRVFQIGLLFKIENLFRK